MYPNCCARRATTSNPPGRKIWAEHGDASQSPLTIRERPLSNLKDRALISVWPFIFQTKATSIGTDRNNGLKGIISDGEKVPPSCECLFNYPNGQDGNRYTRLGESPRSQPYLVVSLILRWVPAVMSNLPRGITSFPISIEQRHPGLRPHLSYAVS
jgi:hypothetical protein